MSLFLRSSLSLFYRSLFALFPSAEVRKKDTLSVAVELNHLEVHGVTNCNSALILFLEVTSGAEAFNAVLEYYNSTLVSYFSYFTLNYGIYAVFSSELFPWILLELFVTERETTVLFVDFEYCNLDLSTDLSKLVRVFDLLGPAEVADVDKTVNALFDLNEYAEVGEVANLSGVV